MSLMQARAANVRRLRFGHCVLDEGLGSLMAPDGASTVLRPKTLELLRILLSHAGRVVAREEILDAVWPGIFVTDDSITQCVVEIRKAMGAGGAGLLKTVPRRGYLLQAEVIEDAPAGAGALLSSRAEDRPSIAVLPFRKDQPDPQEAYFADGIIEGIVHVLSGLERILVVSRGSALALAETTVDPREVGRALGVRYVLYGGVRRAGERLRITTELSEAETGAIIRSDRYDGEAGDLFALQDCIAEQVLATIAPQLRERELARALRKPPESLTAYDLVLRALDEIRSLDREAMRRGRALLEQAAAADPKLGLAHSYTGWTYSLDIAQGWSTDMAADIAAADGAAAAALKCDRADGFAMALRGVLLGYMRHEFDAARRLLDQAVAASPSCALAWGWRALVHCWLGDGAEAVSSAERGYRLAPLDPFTFLHEHILSQAHYTAGDHEMALRWGKASIASNPGHSASWRTMMASLVALGRFDELQEPRTRCMAIEPGFRLGELARRTPMQGEIRDLFIARLRTAGLPD